ncbi:twin-arginine translocase subunit TatB [Pusillimonas sp. TS35]|nr:twin-arginine translocase subunit TatB [Pusillimonas sp. TS35]
MFDVSFSELMLVGVIALIVIGPERLPKVARTLGHLIGRAQRYVGDVKADIQREMDLDELKNIKGQMEDAAQSVKSSMEAASSSLREPLDDARKVLEDASQSLGDIARDAESGVDPKALAQKAVGVQGVAASGTVKSPTQSDTTASESDAAEAAEQAGASAHASTRAVPASADTPAGASTAPENDSLSLPGFDNQATPDTKTGKPS